MTKPNPCATSGEHGMGGWKQHLEGEFTDIPKKQPCPDCRGSKYFIKNEWGEEPCGNCKGIGEVEANG